MAGESERTPRKKRDTSEKRLSILKAAMQAFGEEGYDGVSMDRIADLAGASKRTVYNHFPSKELLFQAVVGRFSEEMGGLKRIAYDPSRELEDQLSEFADAELAVVEDPTWLGFLKVLLGQFIRDPEMAKSTLARYGASEDSLSKWVRSAAEDGRLSVEDPILAAEVFRSMAAGAFTWPSVYRGAPDKKAADKLKRELIATFLGRYKK